MTDTYPEQMTARALADNYAASQQISQAYFNQKMAQTLEAVDAKANIILQKKGDDALLFIPGAVSKFVIAHGYDEETCTWSHGSYFSNLTAASMEFSPAETRPDERTEAIEQFLSEAAKACEKTLEPSEVGESLDELMEQKVEVAGDSEIGDDLGISNGER